MLHSVAHATLSLRCIKVSREKSCNEQGLRVLRAGGQARQRLHLSLRVGAHPPGLLVAKKKSIKIVATNALLGPPFTARKSPL